MEINPSVSSFCSQPRCVLNVAGSDYSGHAAAVVGEYELCCVSVGLADVQQVIALSGNFEALLFRGHNRHQKNFPVDSIDFHDRRDRVIVAVADLCAAELCSTIHFIPDRHEFLTEFREFDHSGGEYCFEVERYDNLQVAFFVARAAFYASLDRVIAVKEGPMTYNIGLANDVQRSRLIGECPGMAARNHLFAICSLCFVLSPSFLEGLKIDLALPYQGERLAAAQVVGAITVAVLKRQI